MPVVSVTERSSNLGQGHIRSLLSVERLREHRLPHLGDEALAGLGQFGDCFDLLLPLRGRAALGAAGPLVHAEEFIERHRMGST